MFGIYKYVYDGEVIYIGKSDNSILNRVNAHAKEAKFKPYLDKAIIYYTVYENSAQTDFYESYFINKYKPKLNVAKMYDGNIGVDIPEPEWHLLSELKEIEKKEKTKKAAVFKTQKAYETRIKKIKERKKHIENLKWLESFLPQFYGLYDIELSVDYTEDNKKIYMRIFELLHSTDGRSLLIGDFPHMDETGKKLSVHFLKKSSCKELDFWNNYKTMIQQTIDEHLAEIFRINSEIREAGFDEYE